MRERSRKELSKTTETSKAVQDLFTSVRSSLALATAYCFDAASRFFSSSVHDLHTSTRADEGFFCRDRLLFSSCGRTFSSCLEHVCPRDEWFLSVQWPCFICQGDRHSQRSLRLESKDIDVGPDRKPSANKSE